MKVKLKEGIGEIANINRTYKPGKEYNILEKHYNPEIFDKVVATPKVVAKPTISVKDNVKKSEKADFKKPAKITVGNINRLKGR